MAYEMFGAIRIGSMEQELCIYEISPQKGIRLIDSVKAGIPIGRDTVRTGHISYEKIEALCETLCGFQNIMKGYKVTASRAYATMAFREAKNAQIVTEQVRVRTGVRIHIISNSEQRFLNYKALALRNRNFDEVIRQSTLIADFGYGSTQFSLFDKGALVSTENMPLGEVRLMNELRENRFTDAQMKRHIAEIVDAELENYRKLYIKNRSIDHLVGIGENVARLFEKHIKKLYCEPVSREEIGELCRRITEMSIEELSSFLEVDRELARLLTVKALVYGRVLEMTDCRDVYFSESRFLDGAAAEYAEKQKLCRPQHDFEEDMIEEARNMAKRYRCNTEHIAMVERCALLIFDALRKISGLGKRERKLLQIAAVLLDCGKFISIKNAPECAYHIILETEIMGLSYDERKLIALAVRSQSGEFNYEEACGSGYPIEAAKLAAVLRLSEALDRSHKGKLSDLRAVCSEGSRELRFISAYSGDATLETLAVEERGAFFEEIFGLKPVLKQKKRM